MQTLFFLYSSWSFHGILGKRGSIFVAAMRMNLSHLQAQGVYLAQGPNLCVRKFVLVMAEPVFPKGTLSQWLRASAMLRLAIPGRHGTSLMVTLVWGLHDGLAELSLELSHSLSYFHSTFLPFLLHWESDLHPKSASLPGFFPMFSYRWSPDIFLAGLILSWYLFPRRPGLTRSPVSLWFSAGLRLWAQIRGFWPQDPGSVPLFNLTFCSGCCAFLMGSSAGVNMGQTQFSLFL